MRVAEEGDLRGPFPQLSKIHGKMQRRTDAALVHGKNDGDCTGRGDTPAERDHPRSRAWCSPGRSRHAGSDGAILPTWISCLRCACGHPCGVNRSARRQPARTREISMHATVEQVSAHSSSRSVNCEGEGGLLRLLPLFTLAIRCNSLLRRELLLLPKPLFSLSPRVMGLSQ